ncbi:unnamed protein product [Anisakis simplex]|uniref:RGS domain-containing protein n=1 Tax=Anisakis simplex TaxID=6269 RepID=A0A0M3K6J4_ANISI|nr:unnamed protein product [Anisakis simplex]
MKLSTTRNSFWFPSIRYVENPGKQRFRGLKTVTGEQFDSHQIHFRSQAFSPVPQNKILAHNDLTYINPEFVLQVKNLVEQTCDPNTIETKKIDKTELTPDMFYEHVNNCIIAINDDTQPLPMSLTAANMQMRCYAAAEKAKNFYRLNVARQMCFRNLSSAEFRQLHDQSLTKALKLYGSAVDGCESPEYIQHHERKLEDFLNDEYEMLAMNVNANEIGKERPARDLQKISRSFSRNSYKERFIQSKLCGIALCVATIASSIVLVFTSKFSSPPDFLLCLVPIVCVTMFAIWCFSHLRYLHRRHQQKERSKEFINVPLLSIV